MKKINYLIIAAVVLSALPNMALGQGSLKGYMVGEYYSVLDHNNKDLKGMNGFWFRRIYFTFDSILTDNISMRLRFEMNSESFGSDKLGAFVKDAYLSAKLGGQSLKAGIQSTPTFGFLFEDIWGYRALEKTPLDLFKFASSRDFGIGLSGDLDSKGIVSYSLLFGNGSSNKGEANKGKRLYGALAFKPAPGFTLSVYGDYEHKSPDSKLTTYQGWATYSGDWGRIGLLYANQALDDGTTTNMGLFSAFAVIKAGEKIDLIARFDKAMTDDWEIKFKGSGLDYVPMADYVRPNFVIVALSWQAAKDLRLIPNIKYSFYDDPARGDKPGSDIYALLTLWFKFK
jgi:hypothetical protein